MPDYVDLEVELYRGAAGKYGFACRLDDPTNNDIPTPENGELTIDVSSLDIKQKNGDIEGYRAELGNSLFGSAGGKLRRNYESAVDIANHINGKVRFRLLIDDTAQEFHHLWWEAIPDPRSSNGRALSMSDVVYFSRVLQHGRSRQLTFRNRTRATTRALAVIANPQPPPAGWNKEDEINTDEERARILGALGSISLTILDSSPKEPGRASITNIIRELNSSYDILYLVCHGTYEYDRQPPDSLLRLEREDGQADFVSGRTFVTEIERLPNPPSIIILCSCETSGTGNIKSREILAALGPQLVHAGVPAVIAMNGEIQRTTAAAFFSTLLAELASEGVIDRAVAVARRKVETTNDYHVPVLYDRLRSGRIWYGSNEPDTQNQAINWEGHVQSLRSGRTTVVLGSALLDPYLGSQADMAIQLANRFRYAFADSERDDLALVGQFGEYVLGRDNLVSAVIGECLEQLIREHRTQLRLTDQEIDRIRKDTKPHSQLKDLLRRVWALQNLNDDPYRMLASLPFKAYMSTNFDDLLEGAMTATSKAKSPTIWPCGLADPRGVTKVRFTKDDQPSPDKPLIAYLYGTLDSPENLVLTEQDYYRQLTDAARGDTALVKSLNSVFTNSALVFLGFRLHEWDFRILYRRLQLIEGWRAHSRFFHIAVQIDPSTARGTGSDSAVKAFLNQFFDSSKIQIFRGSVLQFLRELTTLSQKQAQGAYAGGSK